MVGQPARGVDEYAEAHVYVLSLSNCSKQKSMAFAAANTVAVGALILDQQVLATASDLHLVNADASDGGEGRPGAEPAT
jgi:hypothetical protein